jgi:hypothetical protein
MAAAHSRHKIMKNAYLSFALILGTCILSFGQRPWQTKITFDHIRIEHWGPIDAPIRELIITTKPTNLKLDLMELEILVDKELFSFINNYLETGGLIGKSREVNEFGVFKVTRLVQGEEQIFYFPTRPKSILILKALKENIKDLSTSDKLILEIDKILRRIDY